MSGRETCHGIQVSEFANSSKPHAVMLLLAKAPVNSTAIYSRMFSRIAPSDIIICTHIQYSFTVIISQKDCEVLIMQPDLFTQLYAPIILPSNVHICARGIVLFI